MTSRLCATLLLLAATGATAADVDIRIILPADIAPGIYGRVDLGPAPPPPLVYEKPVIIRRAAAPPPPVYLHVPPGHAKNWGKHCARYGACNQPVYFVKSAEYDPPKKPKKAKKPKKEKHS